MKRLLWIGDAGCQSGFARCTHETLETLRRYYDVSVLALNYRGYPHDYPYPLYPAAAGGHPFGYGSMAEVQALAKPDVIVIQNDPWNFLDYLERIPEKTPVVGVVAVDGKNCRGEVLNHLAAAIFWTRFGKEEAEAGGFTGRGHVIPLGIDTATFTPGDRTEARLALGIPEGLARNAFIVGNVNRNQVRKRLDLTIQYFAEWVKAYDIRDAYLYLHVAPTGEEGIDCNQLMGYYGFSDDNIRLILKQPDVRRGMDEAKVVNTYRAFDVQVTTTQGEGWGLTTMEGMACGIPQIVPDWSALGEWAYHAAHTVPCTSNSITPNCINVIGGVPDKAKFIEALQTMYTMDWWREKKRKQGIELASQEHYRWSHIGERFHHVIEGVLAQREAPVAVAPLEVALV